MKFKFNILKIILMVVSNRETSITRSFNVTIMKHIIGHGLEP